MFHIGIFNPEYNVDKSLSLIWSECFYTATLLSMFLETQNLELNYLLTFSLVVFFFFN